MIRNIKQPKIGFFPGSTIGNFHPKEAKNILSSRLIDEIQNGDDVMNLLGIKEGETDKDAGTIDQLSSLRMVRDKESKIGVKLIKKLVGKVHEEQKINIYEDHVVKFKKYSFDEFEAYDIKKKTKIFLPSEMTILAIGGGLGADGKGRVQCYGD